MSAMEQGQKLLLLRIQKELIKAPENSQRKKSKIFKGVSLCLHFFQNAITPCVRVAQIANGTLLGKAPDD